MNEQVKQLAVQAGAYWREGYVELANGDSELQDKARVDICDIDLQKFVELIISECEKVAKDPQWYNDDWRDPIYYVCRRIEEHFGVKE